MGNKFNRFLRRAAELGIPVGDINQASAIYTGSSGTQAPPPPPPALPAPPDAPPAPIKTKKDQPRIKLKKSRRESLGIGKRSRSQTRVPLNTGSSSTRGGINL
jgi:hypothetical protein